MADIVSIFLVIFCLTFLIPAQKQNENHQAKVELQLRIIEAQQKSPCGQGSVVKNGQH